MPDRRASPLGTLLGVCWVRPLTKHADGMYRTYFGHLIRDPAEVVLAAHKHRRDTGYWHSYTEAQLAQVEALVLALLEEYPPIQHIMGHDDIARGRKLDPGPAFPLERFVSLVDARREDRPDLMVVTARKLNVREGPGTDFEKVDDFGPLRRGTNVSVLEREPPWAFVSAGDGQEGWVNEYYLAQRRA